jgi:membrane protein CcdC involved in cytochrome C biogenesis
MSVVPPLNILSLIASIIGATAVMIWRVQESRTPVSPKKIIIPPLGMATGFSMFIVPMFRVPWTWAATAFLLGAIVLSYPLLRTTKLIRQGETIVMQRSHAFFAVIILLAGIRLGAKSYFDKMLTVQQTAALFFVLAFGIILRWRAHMLFQYRALTFEKASTVGA